MGDGRREEGVGVVVSETGKSLLTNHGTELMHLRRVFRTVLLLRRLFMMMMV